MSIGYTNVIVIMADDLGYGDLSYYGNRYLKTPNIDRLAAEGVALTQHYSASPISAPARAAFLTGRDSHRTGALSVESNRGLDRFSLRERTIADVFRAAGYATGMVGKWHNGLFDRRYHPNQRGFSEFVGFLNGGMDYYDWILDVNGQPRHSDGRYLTDVLSEEALAFIERHQSEPFFLYLAYNAPHSPLQAPEPDIEYFRVLGRFNEAVCRLYAMIRRMDMGIGRILALLDRLGLADQTLILFTSDNGPWLGQQRLPNGRVFSMQRYNGPFRGMKQDVLEGGIRVPAVVRWPAGLPAGQEVTELVHFCDWLPTLLAAAGITDRPAFPLDGTDVLPTLRGASTSTPATVPRFWQFNRYEPIPYCNAAVRYGPWKLYWPRIPEAMAKLPIDNVWYHGMFHVPHFETTIDRAPVLREVPPPSEPELYHLEEDPAEHENRAAQHPDVVASLRQAYDAWFRAVTRERRRLPDVWPRLE